MAESISTSLNGSQRFASRQGRAQRLVIGKILYRCFKTSHKQQQLKIVDLSDGSYRPVSLDFFGQVSSMQNISLTYFSLDTADVVYFFSCLYVELPE